MPPASFLRSALIPKEPIRSSCYLSALLPPLFPLNACRGERCGGLGAAPAPLLTLFFTHEFFYRAKKTKSGSSRPWIVAQGELLPLVVGNRDAATFRKLYEKVKHLKNCIFYTDDWDAFAKILPRDRHIIGKSGTVSIERDNSNTRHHLARMTRRTKVVSKKVNMVYDSIKLWCALTT